MVVPYGLSSSVKLTNEINKQKQRERKAYIQHSRTLLVPLITMLVLQVSCYVRGDDCNNVFIVSINEDETVAALKDAIKEKK